MQTNLADKVALLTGASRGVGARACETLAKAGALDTGVVGGARAHNIDRSMRPTGLTE